MMQWDGMHPMHRQRGPRLRTYRTSSTVDRILSLLRRVERWVDRVLWPWMEATLLERNSVHLWFKWCLALLLTLVVTSQVVMWCRRVFLR